MIFYPYVIFHDVYLATVENLLCRFPYNTT